MAMAPLSSTTAAEASPGLDLCPSEAVVMKLAPCSRSCDGWSVVEVARELNLLGSLLCDQPRLIPAKRYAGRRSSSHFCSRARPLPRSFGRPRARLCSSGSDAPASASTAAASKELGDLEPKQAGWRKGTQATVMVAVPSSEQRAVFQKPVCV